MIIMKTLAILICVVLLAGCTAHRYAAAMPPSAGGPVTWQRVNLNPFVCCDTRYRSSDGRWSIEPSGPPWMRHVCGYGGTWYGSAWALRERVPNDTQFGPPIATGTVEMLKTMAAAH